MAKLSVKNVTNYHMQYSDLTSQHWHPDSEVFAGGDNLITAIAKQWEIESCKLVRHWYAGMRSVRLYEFTLTKDDRTVIMPVLDNPYIERFVKDQNIALIIPEDAEI
ncbi:MAG: hypothetical protein WBC91_18410 [Phototrophicaceae bacterium]